METKTESEAVAETKPQKGILPDFPNLHNGFTAYQTVGGSWAVSDRREDVNVAGACAAEAVMHPPASLLAKPVRRAGQSVRGGDGGGGGADRQLGKRGAGAAQRQNGKKKGWAKQGGRGGRASGGRASGGGALGRSRSRGYSAGQQEARSSDDDFM